MSPLGNPEPLIICAAPACKTRCVVPIATQSHETGYVRNTPGSICQDGLVSRPPSLFTSIRRPTHGTSCSKSQLKSTRPQNLEAFQTTQKWAKKDKMWSVLLSNIRFLWFLQSMFLLSYLYQWCGFCWQSLCRNLWP